MTGWRDAFDKRKGTEVPIGMPIAPASSPLPPPAAFSPASVDQDGDDELTSWPDAQQYQPWIVQRGRGRPAMFIDLRRIEPKTGELVGAQMSYPHLVAVDYLGDHLVSLDFGVRQYIIHGRGLGDLARHLQLGAILAIQEYSPRVWPRQPEGSVVTAIEKVGI